MSTRTALRYVVAVLALAPACSRAHDTNARASVSSGPLYREQDLPAPKWKGAPGQLPVPEYPPITVEVCRHAATEAGKRCKWSTGLQLYAGGAAPNPADLVPRPICICNGCEWDADCSDGQDGKCVDTTAPRVDGTERGCVYSGDACHPASPGCKSRCALDERTGRVACAPPYQAPP